MNLGKSILLMALLGIATNDAMARKPSLRSIKNFFVERGINAKQHGLSAVLACSLTVAACGATKIDGEYYLYKQGEIFRADYRHHPEQSSSASDHSLLDPLLFAKAALAPFGFLSPKKTSYRGGAHRHAVQGGMIWHAQKDTSGAFKIFGRTYRYYKGLYATHSDKKKYLTRAPNFKPQDYQGIEVVYNDEGVFRRGLAVQKLDTDDSVFILFPHSDEYQIITIDKIVGVLYTWAKNYIQSYDNIVEIVKEDVLPFSPNNKQPIATSDLGLDEGEVYWGYPIKVYSNGTSLVKIPSLKINVLIKKDVIFYR